METLCRSRKAQCFSCAFLCLCIVQASTMAWLFRRMILKQDAPGQLGNRYIRCEDNYNRAFLEKLCTNYTSAVGMWGTMCPALCTTKTLRFSKCLGHKTSDLVMLGLYNDEKVIMKADVGLSHTISSHFKDMTPEAAAQYSITANDMRYAMTRYYHLGHQVVDMVIQECDANADSKINYNEAIHCWHMVDEQESLIMLQLAGNPAIPTLYGTCHNLFVIEYAPTDPLTTIPKFTEYRSWGFRVKLALGLIEMVKSLEHPSPNKTLHLCDFQEANLGVLKNENGDYIVKSIDNDASLFQYHLAKVIRGNEFVCQTDKECSLLDCMSTCNEEIGKCSGVLTSNNLQVLCRKFFTDHSPVGHPVTNILNNPPAAVAQELASLVHQCSYPATPSTSISVELADKLKSVLLRSLDAIQ